MRNTIKIERSVLQDLYVDKNYSMKKIQDMFGITNYSLCNLLKEYGLGKGGHVPDKIIDKNVLIEMLINKGMNKLEASKCLKISVQTLNKNIKRYNIEIPEKEYNVKEMIRLYIEEKKTMSEIADILGECKISTVRRILINAGIEPRTGGFIEGKEYNLESPFKINVDEDKIPKLIELFNNCVPIRVISEEINTSPKAVQRKIKELNLIRPTSMKSRNLYDDSNDEEIVRLYNEGKSTTEIGKIFGVSHGTVISHLERCGVTRRTLSQSQFVKNKKELPEVLNNYDKLYEMYVENNMSKKDIALNLGIDPSTVDRMLKIFDIHVRGVSESKKGLYIGENHPNWKGGRTGLYMRIREYSYKNVAPIAMKRDHYRCQYPGCNSDHRPNVHHIKPFKEIFNEILSEHTELDLHDNEEELYKIMINDPRINDTDNLITYCRDCHLFKVHGYKRSSEEINTEPK